MRAYAAWAVLAAGAAYETQTDLSCASSNAPCPTLWGLTRGLESSVAPFLELEAGANLSLSLSVVTAGTSSPSTTAVALRSDCLDFALVHVGCVVDDGACEERSVATVSTTAEELATCDGAAHDGTGALTLPLVRRRWLGRRAPRPAGHPAVAAGEPGAGGVLARRRRRCFRGAGEVTCVAVVGSSCGVRRRRARPVAAGGPQVAKRLATKASDLTTGGQHGHLRLQMRKMPVPDGGPTDLDEPRRRRK